MKKINLLSICVLMFLPIFSISQQPSIIPVHFPGDQTITNIVGMTQDNNGFIWIADNNSGLFKYDGNHLIGYKPDANNRNSIIASRLECVYADTKGNIWIGTFQNGLECFDPETETFTLFQRNNTDPSSLCSDSVRAILEDNNGSIWVGLGLSLSYDIVKAHGGEIKVNTKEGEGTEFIIQLPL